MLSDIWRRELFFLFVFFCTLEMGFKDFSRRISLPHKQRSSDPNLYGITISPQSTVLTTGCYNDMEGYTTELGGNYIWLHCTKYCQWEFSRFRPTTQPLCFGTTFADCGRLLSHKLTLALKNPTTVVECKKSAVLRLSSRDHRDFIGLSKELKLQLIKDMHKVVF